MRYAISLLQERGVEDYYLNSPVEVYMSVVNGEYLDKINSIRSSIKNRMITLVFSLPLIGNRTSE